MGMQTALTQRQSLICSHIDRHVLTGTGEAYKSDLSIGMHGAFAIPFFTASSLEVEWIDFRAVAAIAHLGDDQAGHYRATLRVQADFTDDTNPVMHLLTDDNTMPSQCWQEPDWFIQNVRCIWLCATDALTLHRLTDRRPTPVTDPARPPRKACFDRLLQQFR